MSKVQEILAQVRELELPEQLELMDLMLELDAEPGYAEAWDLELRRRIEEVDSGAVTLIPCEEALRQIATLDS